MFVKFLQGSSVAFLVAFVVIPSKSMANFGHFLEQKGLYEHPGGRLVEVSVMGNCQKNCDNIPKKYSNKKYDVQKMRQVCHEDCRKTGGFSHAAVHPIVRVTP